MFVVLLRNTRKTECGASQLLTLMVVRAAPFALLTLFFAAGLWAETTSETRAVVKRVLDGMMTEDRARPDWTYLVHDEVKDLDSDGHVKTQKTTVSRRELVDGVVVRRLIERDG